MRLGTPGLLPQAPSAPRRRSLLPRAPEGALEEQAVIWRHGGAADGHFELGAAFTNRMFTMSS